MNDTLHLSLVKKWYDMILSGEKLEEYRVFKDHWIKRLEYWEDKDTLTGEEYVEIGYIPKYIKFTNGYGAHRPNFTIEVLEVLVDKSTHPEWGGDTENKQFIFRLGKIIESNWNK